MVRSLITLALAGTVGACAQTQQEQETQQAAQTQQGQQIQQAQATPSCFLRGDPAGLSQRESAFDSVSASVGNRTIKVCYGRPQMRGRTIFGGLVPYGQPWRIGANEATVVHMPSAGTIAGVPVQAGSYSLYVVPTANEWQVFVNRNAQRWGVPINDAVRGNDIGSGRVTPERTSSPVEALTARLENASGNGATLVFEWENTRVRIPVTLQNT